MRFAALGLFFCASTIGICQLTPVEPVACDQTPLLTVPHVQDLKASASWHSAKHDCSSLQPQREVSVSVLQLGSVRPQSDPMIRQPFNAETLDARMIVHPPLSSLGIQSQGVPVEKNLYPDLKMQLIGQTNLAEVQPIPGPWPMLEIKPIPVIWPKLTMIPAQKAKGTPEK